MYIYNFFKLKYFNLQIRYKGKKLDAFKHAYFRKRESSHIESVKDNKVQGN